MSQASLFDLVFIVGGTVACWYLIFKPLIGWLQGPGVFKGFKVVPKDQYDPGWDADGEKTKRLRAALREPESPPPWL